MSNVGKICGKSIGNVSKIMGVDINNLSSFMSLIISIGYSPPEGNQLNFVFGESYTPPSDTGVDF